VLVLLLESIVSLSIYPVQGTQELFLHLNVPPLL
jgi:hypothetical protein